MQSLIKLLFGWLASFLRSHWRLRAENVVLRHQLNIPGRRAPGRLRLSNVDRLVFVWLYRLCPAVVDAVAIIRPETLIRWRRQEFRAFWPPHKQLARLISRRMAGDLLGLATAIGGLSEASPTHRKRDLRPRRGCSACL